MVYDNNFLLELDKQKNKIIYAKITALNFDESPIEQIEGRVISGSINLDGKSAIRRSCSLTLVTKDFRYNNYNWSLRTKFKLEIGIENNLNSNYEKIIWFNQGIYLITSFQSSLTPNNFTISISGKDKMVLLNGEMGGMINFTTDFCEIEEEIDGDWVIKRLPIYEIIRNAVHSYAKEPYQNIIIKDLEEKGKQLIEYRGKKPLYLARKNNSNFYNKILKDENQECLLYFPDQTGQIPINFIKKTLLKDIENIDLETLINFGEIKSVPKLIKFENDENYYYIAKIEYGQTVGYKEIDLIIPESKNLITNPGESIVTVFDNIIKIILNDYEYFYNLDGQFIFQKKQIYINSSWSPLKISNEEMYVDGNFENNKYGYDFNDGQLIINFNNQSNLSNLKNDYSVVGKRKTVNNVETPIIMRYVIDIKPIEYTSITVEENNEELLYLCEKQKIEYKTQKSKKYSIEKYDWREIIYQMAKDWQRYGQLSDFQLRVAKANKTAYPSGVTGYEAYYTDIYSNWRNLYQPHIWSYNLMLERKINDLQIQLENETNETVKINLAKKIESLIGQKVNDINYYYYLYDKDGNISWGEQIIEDIYFSNKNIYNKNNKKMVIGKALRPKLLNKIPVFNELKKLDIYNKKTKKLLIDNINKKKVIGNTIQTVYSNSNLYWNKTVYEKPDALDFWFDFLNGGELQQYNVQAIGNRPKAINDDSVKAIYYKETPDIIFVEDEKDINPEFSYKYIKYENIDESFSVSTQGRTAKNKIDELLYQHGCVIENATITTVPIYYLQPNIRVFIYDEKTGINGDYVIEKLTIPLTYNGTMSITASKVIENFVG